MKFKRVIKTILVFIPVMILICLLFGLVFYLMDPIRFDYSENQIGNYLLYLLGYGSLAKHEIVVQNLLAVIGIISLSIFTANLTVNLFWKNGNIRISTELLTWKEKQNQLTASLLIGNSGENIYGPLYSQNYYRIVKEKNRTYYEVYSLPRTETPPEDYTQVSFVCLRPDGAYEAPATVSSVCRYSRKKIGNMYDFHFHLLRHTYTTNLLSHGAAPKDVQELLGHSDVSTTMNIYAHATREAKRTSARLLDKVVGTA